MGLETVFSTKERIKILSYILYEEEIRINKVAKELQMSKGLISKYVDILKKEKIVTKKKKNITFIESPLLKGIKILLSLNNIKTKIFKKNKKIKAAGIYGSVIKGTNTKDSDIDIWVLTENATEKDLAKISEELRKWNAKTKVLFLTKEKIKKLQKEETVFYYSLFFASYTIYGGDIEDVQ